MENYQVVREDIGTGITLNFNFLGTFGKVCLVKHLPSGRLMVWKQVNYGFMKEKEKQQLINEVNIMRELRHENIVRYYDKIHDKK